MRLHKEYWMAGIDGDVVNATIFTNSYDKSFDCVSNLVAECKKDYPGIKNSDIKVVIFGGERRRGVLGIEFQPKIAGKGYMQVNNPEPLA